MHATLRCIGCGRSHPNSELYACPDCGGELDLAYDLEAVQAEGRFATDWLRPLPLAQRFAALFPLERPESAVTLGEGATPLVRSRRLAERLGMKALHFKLEGSNPTGSFKDRQVSIALSRALELGRRAFATVSSGNAGNAVAAYAARAGCPAHVWVSLETAEAKRQQIQIYGAQLFELPSPVADGGPDPYFQAFKDLPAFAAQQGLVPMITARSVNPFMVEGAKSVAYEVAASLGRAPEVVFCPLGGGGLLGGLFKGFCELAGLGLTAGVPQVRAAQRKAYFAPADRLDDPAFAQGYYIPLDGHWAWNSVQASGGDLIRVEDEAIRAAQGLLAESEGIFAEPHGAYTVAALLAAHDAGTLERDAETVCVISGLGLKDMAAARHVVETYGSHAVRQVESLAASLPFLARPTADGDR